jgi:hypothetical protein
MAMPAELPTPLTCHACNVPIEGEPAGSGLLVFPRGDRNHYEEPPLCTRCAHAIGMTALWRWAEEEDGG